MKLLNERAAPSLSSPSPRSGNISHCCSQVTFTSCQASVGWQLSFPKAPCVFWGIREIKRISSSGRDQLVPAKAACGQAIAFLDHGQEWSNYSFKTVKILTMIRKKIFLILFLLSASVISNYAEHWKTSNLLVKEIIQKWAGAEAQFLWDPVFNYV